MAQWPTKEIVKFSVFHGEVSVLEGEIENQKKKVEDFIREH